MNHLPFGWSDDVDDGAVEAHFIGGPWDSKIYTIPCLMKEYPVAILPIPKQRFINKPPGELVKYDVAIYKHILHGVYWFTRIEKGDE